MLWLARPNKECGNIYGMLPLLNDMPMALTDHIDLSPDKNLLAGTIGHVHSWVLDPNEPAVTQGAVRPLQHLPLVVFLKTPGAVWQSPGLEEPGLYPVSQRGICGISMQGK